MSVMADSNINIIVVPDAPTAAAADEKPERAFLVDMKNGKPVIKQKVLSFEKMSETMQEIVKFREMLEQRIESKTESLTAIPDEHKPLIAKLVQESDKGLQALSKHIQQELLPSQDEDDEEASVTISSALSVEVVEKAIKSVAVRTNYGLDAAHAPNGRIPASWQIWRWEVKAELRGWLPKASQEKAALRLAEREQAKCDIEAIFLALPDAERTALVGSKTPANAKVASNVKDKPKPSDNEVVIVATSASAQGSTTPSKRKKDADAENTSKQADDDEASKKASKPKKVVDPEKAAKEKDRQEKRLARAEKERKEKEAQSKSRNLMANFFGKSRVTAGTASESRSNSIPKESSERGQSETKEEVNRPSDFARVFKPFLLKKDAELASSNWLIEVRSCRPRHTIDVDNKDVIVVDADEPDVHMGGIDPHHRGDAPMHDISQLSTALDRGQMTAEDRLRESLSSLPPFLRPPLLPYPPRRYRTLRSYHRHSVRATLQELNEAEIAGDEVAVRDLLSRLQDRQSIPAKVLIFHQDARPGYFGTWTRNSKEVGPRKPFARDVVSLDYGVDSGEEWEDEEEGEVVDGDEEEEGAATEEVDSDLDSWLVDDEEVEDPGTPIDDRLGTPDFFPPPLPKRKAKEADADPSKKDGKKRKVVIPLVSFVKGPCWEATIGDCTYEPFSAYRIHLLNDTSFPIDPFKFVAAPTTDTASSKTQPTQTSTGFVVPPLPARLSLASTPSLGVAKTNTHLQPGPPLLKRAAPPPKTSFPDVHMPFLITKIKELDTGNLTFIVESIYKELSSLTKTTGVPSVKKNAIEAKVKEVGEKDKKVWVIKPEIKVAYGVA